MLCCYFQLEEKKKKTTNKSLAYLTITPRRMFLITDWLARKTLCVGK